MGVTNHVEHYVYGGQSGTEAQMKYYAAFKEKYPGVTGAQENWKREVLHTKQLRTASGLIFYWPDTKMSSSGYITNSTSICNYPVQMFATADIIPIGLVYLWHKLYLVNAKSFIVNTVHDSAIGEVHPDEEVLYGKLLKSSFVEDTYRYLKNVYNVDFNVELEADYEVKTHWNDSPYWREEYLGEAT